MLLAPIFIEAAYFCYRLYARCTKLIWIRKLEVVRLNKNLGWNQFPCLKFDCEIHTDLSKYFPEG